MGSSIQPGYAPGQRRLTPREVEQTLASQRPAKFISGRQLLEGECEQIPMLIEPLVPQVGLTALVGGSDVGKSSFLRQLATAVALGDSTFLGFRLNTRNRRAIYVSTEDDEGHVRFLLRVQSEVRGLPASAYDGLSYLFETEDVLSDLQEMLSQYPADLIILDAYSDLFTGQLNDAQQVRAFLSGFHQMAVRFKCAVILLHHTGKYKDEQQPSKHHVVGSQAFEAKMRLVLELRPDVLDADTLHLCILKGNYLPNAQKQQTYVLRRDQAMTFHTTGQRNELSSLQRPARAETGGYTLAKYQEAKEMRDAGKTLDEIAVALGYQHRSAISKLIHKFEDGQTPA